MEDLLNRSRISKASQLLREVERDEDASPNKAATCAGFLDLSPRDLKKYSVLRAITTKLDSILSIAGGRGHGFEGFEAECHATLATKRGRPEHAGAVLIPSDVLYRDLGVAGGAGGGFLVATSGGGSFIDVLRKQSVVFRLGATRMPGQRDTLAIPRQATDPTITWLTDEITQATESTPAFTQVAGTPKTCSSYHEWSRKLLQQTDPATEAKVMNTLAASVAVGVDAAALNGSGASGQPTGILNTSGIGTVSGTTLGYTGLVEAQTDIADANAIHNPNTLGYVTTPLIAQALKSRQRFTSTDSPVWQGAIHQGMIEGVPALSTKNMPASTMLYGDWSAIVIGEWDALTIEVNPFTDFKAGIVGVRSLWSVDVLVTQPLSFSAITNIT